MGLFGGSSKVELPPPPSFYSNPYVLQAIQQGLGYGNDFINQGNSLSPSLREAVSVDPRASQYAIESATTSLMPSLRDSRARIIADLEANNQLTGSTTASSLQSLEGDFLSRIQAAGLDAARADVERALGARVALAGQGGNLIGNAGNQALTDQSQHNEFNLANYENEVARVLAGQKPEKGGLIGALTGGLGGAMAGSMFGPLGMIAGGLIGGTAGAMSPSGTGGQLLTAGAGVSGARLSQPRPIQSNPFTLSSNQGETINDTLRITGSQGPQGGFWSTMYGGLR